MTKKEVKEFHIHDPFFRQALWKAHKKRCAYTGEPIRFSDLQVEHIIPQRLFKQPDNLKSLLVDLGLPEDFHKDQPENLLPTLGFANRQKSDEINLLQIKHALNNAQRKLSDVKEIYSCIKNDDEKGIAKLRLFHGVRTGEISTKDIGGWLNEITMGNISGLLNRHLIFSDKELVDISEINEPCTLLDKAICPRTDGLQYLTLINDSGSEKIVVSCRDWLNGLSRGYYAKTNYDIKESAFFEAVGSLVWALKFRRLPLESNLLGGLLDIGRLPPQILPHLSGDETRALENYASQGESVKSLLIAQDITPDLGKFSVGFTYKHMEAFMWEVLRGDFSGDGYEDLLISKYERVVDGTYASNESLILSARDNSSKFEIARLNESDFIKLLSLDE